MKYLYLVPWIEVEFGQRPEGFKVFSSEENCIESTKESANKGTYSNGEGYFGPEKPLHYYKVSFDKEMSKKAYVDKLPELKSDPVYI